MALSRSNRQSLAWLPLVAAALSAAGLGGCQPPAAEDGPLPLPALSAMPALVRQQATTDPVSFRVISAGSKLGYADLFGRIVIDPQFDYAGEFVDGRARVNLGGALLRSERPGATFVGGKWGYIDAKGRYIVAPEYDAATDFSEGLARVNTGFQLSDDGETVASPGLWGYVDVNGKLVLPIQYDEAGPFAGGHARVRLGQKIGYIDPAGVFLWEPKREAPRGGGSK